MTNTNNTEIDNLLLEICKHHISICRITPADFSTMLMDLASQSCEDQVSIFRDKFEKLQNNKEFE